MDSISSQFSIKFAIKRRPSLPIENIAVAETEGQLVLSYNQTSIFDEDDILLIEFYRSMLHWLTQPFLADFIYDSMDYEDSPILKFEVDKGWVIISSVWMNKKINSPVKIEEHVFKREIEYFIERFECELPEVKQLF